MARRCILVGLAVVLGVILAVGGGSAAKEKLKVILTDDMSPKAVLYGVVKGHVASDTVELEIEHASIPAVIQAGLSKTHDISEGTPMALPKARRRGFEFLIVGAGIRSLNGTTLVVRADSDIKSPADLKGKTIGVNALATTFFTSTRYVLSKKYGLNMDVKSGDLQFVQSPLPTLLKLLALKKIDAALLVHFFSYVAGNDPQFRILLRPDLEYTALTGEHTVNSVLVTYPDFVAKKGAAIREAARLIRASHDYFQANREAVMKEVTGGDAKKMSYLKWWWERYDYPVTNTPQYSRELDRFWGVMKEMNDLDERASAETFLLK